MSTMTLADTIIENLRRRRGFDRAFDLDDDILEEIQQEMVDAIDAHLRERESAKEGVTDSDAFDRGFVRGYEGGLGAAAAECRRQASALDHAGNEYIRYADAIKCAAAIGALRPPELNELSVNSGQLPEGCHVMKE